MNTIIPEGYQVVLRSNGLFYPMLYVNLSNEWIDIIPGGVTKLTTALNACQDHFLVLSGVGLEVWGNTYAGEWI